MAWGRRSLFEKTWHIYFYNSPFLELQTWYNSQKTYRSFSLELQSDLVKMFCDQFLLSRKKNPFLPTKALDSTSCYVNSDILLSYLFVKM